MTRELVRRLRVTAANLRGDRVDIQTLLNAHGPATHGALLALLATPCLLPVPGVAIALGIGLAAVAVQMFRGERDIRMPQRIAALEVPRSTAQRMLRLLAKVYAVAARRATRRFALLAGPAAGRLAAATAALMAVLIVLPIPLGNFPAALALILLGVGLVTGDGILVLASYLIASVAILVNVTVGAVAWEVGRAWIANLT